MFSEYIEYIINKGKIFSKGKTKALISSKYEFNSRNVIFLKNSMRLISKENTTITDNFNLYNLKNLYYSVNDEELKGEKITIDTNYKLPKRISFILIVQL